MQTQVTVYNVFLASPQDTQDSKRAAREAIGLWNIANSKARRVFLNPVGWETDASPDMGASPQTIINRQLLDEADLLIAFFHTRLGQPTAAARSGTVEEIEYFLAKGRPVAIYFDSSRVDIRAIDTEELVFCPINFLHYFCSGSGVLFLEPLCQSPVAPATSN
jgi:nucleoside 2-deoxyribosyltransferase